MQTVLLFGLTGLIAGSFGSVIVERIPRSQSLLGRSQCPLCRKSLGWWNLIPILSFLFQRGTCTQCKTSISPLYPLLETGSAAVFVAALFLSKFLLLQSMILGLALWLLLLIAIIDARTQGIPDLLNIPFCLLTLTLGWIEGWIAFEALLIGPMFFGLQWAISRGRWVGSGDIILSFGIGALLGSTKDMITALAIAYILGGIVAVLLILTKKKTRRDHLAFGPFLAVGTMVVMLLQ